MTKRRTTKTSLVTSAIALLLCFTMLLGTTFAWFTDSVTSAGNIIQTGTLDVEMYWAEGTEDPSTVTWQDASRGAIFNYNNWEPGYVEVRHIKIENKGSLALTYKLSIIANGEVSDLSDVIDVYYLDPAAQIAARDQLNANNKLGTLTEVLANLAETGTGSLAKGESDTVTLALKMQETAGNEYQEKALCDGGFSVQLLATQAVGEFDSFGDDYDNNAAADFFPGFQGGSAGVAVTTDDQGVTVGESAINAGDVSAVIPEGVKLADGANSLQLAVTLKNSSDANIQLSEAEKLGTLDVHIEGVAEGNTTPMLVTLKGYLTTGINTGALRLYHVENGATVAMTQVATPVNHNEFSYDPATGDVTLALASFSEVAVVADTNNPWDGETLNYLWYDADATELTIYNADQLAGFAAIVDGKAENIAQDSFDDKTVKLGNNIYLSGKLFEPIGWGYENNGWNVNDRDGKPFKGTFDGGQYEGGKLVGRYTIFDLHQSGWDLINEGTGEAYTYTNCGFGLFAAASGATFKNLTISGARIRVECVEAGVLVGLSQNNCTYENIKILDSKIANYQRPAGGLIGEVSGEGTTTITNVTIGDDVVVGSLWGDFDAPVGGVIGAYWDDVGAKPQIEMSYVDVGCRLDVYNDVTAAYQWHAYRRAGMLIGNAELTDPDNKHLADARTYLTCLKDKDGNDTVKVYYGDWANYHYAQFTNQDNDWCNNYPWVRVEAGENCSAYSNPRYGVPVVNGVKVSDMDATTLENTQTGYVERRFNQLYGGGQGVYGRDEHPGVTVPNSYYSVTYVNDGKTLDIVYVTDNSEAFTVGSHQAQKLVEEWAEKNMKEDYNSYVFGGWMTSASVKLDKIPAGHDKNIVLYPYFTSPYTASFVDENSNILAWCFFNEVNVYNLPATFAAAKENLPNPGDDFELLHWVIRGTNLKDGTVKVVLANDNTNWESFKGYKDVTITPHYRYKGADLIEVYDELTGEIDHYQVAGYADGIGSEIVEIPDYVNGKPVIKINDGAFKSYDDIYAAVIPGTITSIGSNAFTEISGTKRDQVTLYYQGNPDDWKRAMDDLYVNKAYSYYTDYNTAGTYTGDAKLKLDSSWDSGAGDGSRIFFLDENGNVDPSKGYWELYKTWGKNGSGWLAYGDIFIWVYHDHPYDNTLDDYKNCSHKNTHYGSFTDYDADDRPDQEYWT